MLNQLLLALLLVPALSFGQATSDSTGSSLSAENAKKILDHHNKARAELHIPPLTWSSTLAAYAQEWADSLASTDDCLFEHRPNNEYGENIFMSSPNDKFNPVQASQAWYSEKKKFTYAKIGEGNDWDKALHYTQMIWKKTTEMGAGMATSSNGNIIIVANYNPAGNMSGDYPY